MTMTIKELVAKMDGLGAWDVAMPCHWAVKPRGCAFPYFCCTMRGEIESVKVRFLMLEGWQTFHDFVRTRHDCDFGFYSVPMEFSHFELVLLRDGEPGLYRHDPGYMPREANAREQELCGRMLWEAYGVMLRLETDKRLPLRFSEQKAVFARVEAQDGTWRDEPIEIPAPRPHVEKVVFSKKTISAAKDLPVRQDDIWELDMRMVPGITTNEKRPRLLYLLGAVDAKTGAIVFRERLSMDPESGLRGLWEGMAPRVLAHFVARRAIPSEVRVLTGRLFRLMRPLCEEVPFRLSKVTDLPHYSTAFENLV